MDIMNITQYIKDVIALHSHQLHFAHSDKLPDNILEWLIGHGTAAELASLTCITASLLNRGATSFDCARYAIDGSVRLPFAGCEEHLTEAIFTSMHESGHSELSIAQLVELLCLFGDIAANLVNERSQLSQPAGLSVDEIMRMS